MSPIGEAASLVPQELLVASIDEVQAAQAVVGQPTAALDAGYLCGRWFARVGAYECALRFARRQQR